MSLRIIGGKLRGRILKTPKGDTTRPTTSMLREALFNICAGLIVEARFLDLFAGSGAMGVEAISRGALFATCIDRDGQAIQCIKDNITSLGIEPEVQILKADVAKALPKLMSPYDVIYIDPPYDQEALNVLRLLHEYKLLVPGGMLFLEQRYDSKIDWTESPFLHVGSRRYGTSHLHQFQ